jgi:hypothetical protein
MENNTAAGHVDIDRERLGSLCFGFQDLPISGADGFVSSGQFPHERVSTIVVKVDASNVRVVQGTGSSALLAVAHASAIEVGGRGSTTSGTRESRSLKLLIAVLAGLESLQEIGRRLRGKLIVTKTNTDRATREVKAIHLLQSFPSLTGITEPARVLVGFRDESINGLLTGQTHSHDCGRYRLSATGQTRALRTAQRRSAGPSR